MPPMDPADAKVLVEQSVTRWADNLQVAQKLYAWRLQDAQRGVPLQRLYAGEGTLGGELAGLRGEIQAIRTYLAEARSALAQSGPAITNFLRTAYQASMQVAQTSGQFIAQYEAEVQAGGSGAIAATGGAIQYYVGGSAAAGATAGTAAAGTTAAGVAAGDTVAGAVAAGVAAGDTVAVGVAAGETVAGGVAAAETVAGGVAAAETVAGGVAAAETVAGGVAATATAAEGTVGTTLATGTAGGSWLGPVGIAIGIAIAALVVGGVYVYTQRGSNRPATVAPATTATAPTARSGPPGANLFTCPQTIDGWTLDPSASGLHDLENGKYSFSCWYDYMLGFLAAWDEAPASASCPIDGFVTGPDGMGGNIVSTTKLAMVTYRSDSAGYEVSAPSMKDHAQELLAVVEARAAPCPP